MEVDPQFNEMKAARSDKPQSPNTAKFEDGRRISIATTRDIQVTRDSFPFQKICTDEERTGKFEFEVATSAYTTAAR